MTVMRDIPSAAALREAIEASPRWRMVVSAMGKSTATAASIIAEEMREYLVDQARASRPAVTADVVHTGSHENSRTAAERHRPRAGTLRLQVMDHIAAKGAHGATSEEAQIAFDETHQTMSATVSGLAKDGWLIDSDRKRPTRKGNPATVYVTHPDFDGTSTP